MTVGSPSPSRYIILFPAVACFIGLGINWTISLFNKLPKVKLTISSLVTLTLITTSIYSYWKHETIDTWKYDFNTQVATYAGRYLTSLPNQNYQIYFVGNKYMYYDAIPTLPFLTAKEGQDIFGSVNQLEFNNAMGNKYIIILPSRQNEIKTIKAMFPKASTKTFHNPLGELLFYLVEVWFFVD